MQIGNHWRKNLLKNHLCRTFQFNKDKTCVPSMIHSARPTVLPVTITILAWKLFCFARFWKVLKYWSIDVLKDGRTDVQTTHAKIVITTSLDCGSASWINFSFRNQVKRDAINFSCIDNFFWHTGLELELCRSKAIHANTWLILAQSRRWTFFWLALSPEFSHNQTL